MEQSFHFTGFKMIMSYSQQLTVEYIEQCWIFSGRVISRRREIIWLAHRPDLNSLDFWFWGYVESQLISKNPININDMKVAFEGIVSNIPQDMVQRAAANPIWGVLEDCVYQWDTSNFPLSHQHYNNLPLCSNIQTVLCAICQIVKRFASVAVNVSSLFVWPIRISEDRSKATKLYTLENQWRQIQGNETYYRFNWTSVSIFLEK